MTVEAVGISGRTAAEIIDSVRDLIDRAVLAPGDPLPPVRALATELGINRNTVVAAYSSLVTAGVLSSHGRGGTRVRSDERPARPSGSGLRDIGDGNPDAELIPDITSALDGLSIDPVLYGASALDQRLDAVAREWFAPDVPHVNGLTVSHGGVDAVDRLLSLSLLRDDVVGLEDPCVQAAIHTVRLAGLRPTPLPVDAEGLEVDGVARALDQGARALVYSPRAQNPTGASLSPRRADALRALLADHPYLLLIEDDHYSLLSDAPYVSLITSEHQRWAVVRSVSKFLGPDLGVAVTASDSTTAERLAARQSPGTAWVSHLLQRLAATLLSDTEVRDRIQRAGEHYAERNAGFVTALRNAGFATQKGAGLSLWLDTGRDAGSVAAVLADRGWRALTGDEFRLDASAGTETHLRLTVHTLDDAEREKLVADLAEAIRVTG